MLEQLRFTLLDNVDDLIDVVEAYVSRKETPVAFDTETTGLSHIDARLISLQFMQFGYLPILVDTRAWTRRQMQEAGRHLQALFDQCKIVGMNLSFDYKMLKAKTGVSIGRCYDIMLVEQVLYGLGKTGGRDKGIEFNLKSIAGRYGVEVSKEERNIFIDMDKNPDLWNAPFRVETLNYMAQDVEVLEDIYRLQLPKIAQSKLGHVVNLENRALPAVSSIEYNGIHVDESGWRKIIEEKAKLADELEQEAIEVFGAVITKLRAKRFKKQMKAYKVWQSNLEDELHRCEEAWAETGLDKGWGDFKKGYMSEFRNLYPNPGIPKLESDDPYAEWLVSRSAFEKEIREVYKTYDSPPGLDKESWLAAQVQEWEMYHPAPEPDDYILSLHESRNLCYQPINLGSSKQMLEAFKELGIPLDSTSKDAIADLPDGLYPQVDLLKRWREAEMFPTKFGEKLLAQINKQTLRIYPQIHQIGADTGRMSVSNPPWQQIPSKTKDGQRLRACVVAQFGHVLVTSDFPNIELRILADLSQDRQMLKFFADGVDLHAATARMMFNLDDNFDPKNDRHKSGVLYRQIAKTINFGLVYGMSAFKLARTLKISKEEAQDLMNRYFDLYPGIVSWLKKQRVLCVSDLVSKTVTGRKRFYDPLPARGSGDYNRFRSAIERAGCNAPIQGSSADITKLALALAYERLPEDCLLVAVVHDEIVIEAPKSKGQLAANILTEAMSEACEKYLKRVHIPELECSISDHWTH